MTKNTEKNDFEEYWWVYLFLVFLCFLYIAGSGFTHEMFEFLIKSIRTFWIITLWLVCSIGLIMWCGEGA